MVKSRGSFIAEVASGAYGLPYAAARTTETFTPPLESAANSCTSASRVSSRRRLGHLVGIGKTAVSDFLRRAAVAGLSSWEAIAELDEGRRSTEHRFAMAR
jgi:hypothetical protein